MKSLKIKLAVIAFFLVVGSVSAGVQKSSGDCIKLKDCTTQTGTCVTKLTVEQRAIIDDLRADYQEAIDLLRIELQSTSNLAEKIILRAEMVDLRNEFLAEVQSLLEEWGVK